MHFFTQHRVRTGYILLACVAALFFILTSIAEAQYQPLTGLPGVTTSSPSLKSYIEQLFLISISLGAMLAVVKISLAGFSYMMSDIITKKEQAKEDIKGALLGLGILLASVTILTVINPELTKFNILEHAVDVPVEAGVSTELDVDDQTVDCPEGSEFVKAREDLEGSCVITTSSTIPEELIEDGVSGGGLNSYCSVQHPGSTYNPTTGDCETKEYVNMVPESDIAAGLADEYCYNIGKITFEYFIFDEATGSCVKKD